MPGPAHGAAPVTGASSNGSPVMSTSPAKPRAAGPSPSQPLARRSSLAAVRTTRRAVTRVFWTVVADRDRVMAGNPPWDGPEPRFTRLTQARRGLAAMMTYPVMELGAGRSASTPGALAAANVFGHLVGALLARHPIAHRKPFLGHSSRSPASGSLTALGP